MKILIPIVVLIIILAVSLLFILKKDYEENEAVKIYEDVDDPILSQKKIENKVRILDNRNEYYIVQDCINKYYLYRIKEQGNFNTDDAGEDINNKMIYSMLDKNYIDYAKINEDNVFEKIPKINNVKIIINKVFVVEYSENENMYIVYANLRNIIDNDQKQIIVGVRLNLLKNIFKIIEQDYIKDTYGDISEGQILNLSLNEEIENDQYNIFEYNSISDEQYINDVFNKLKEYILYDQSLAYQLLDEDYSSKRFENYNEFKKYLSDNSLRDFKMKLTKYKKNKYSDYTQYICIDNNKRYLIFKEKSVMNFKVMLDGHTIDLDEFTQKYNSSNKQIKVGMNIEKLLSAINEKDYRYLYSKLDDTFKQNNFDNINKFEEYMRKNAYDINEIEYGDYEEKGSVIVYKIELVNSSNKSEKRKYNIIMKLQEKSDFVFSFNV